MKKFCILLISLFQCMQNTAQSKINDFVGEYWLQGVMETASGLRLNPDSTFQFFYSYGAVDREGKGKWKVENNTIILNSALRPKTDFALVKSEKIPGDSTIVKVSDNNKMILRYVQLTFQVGSEVYFAETDQSGTASINQGKIDTISMLFTLCPNRPSVFGQLNKNHNYFEFKFEKWICELFFEDLKLRPGKDGLIGQHPLLMGENFRYIKNLP